jgi:hypothetical protein
LPRWRALIRGKQTGLRRRRWKTGCAASIAMTRCSGSFKDGARCELGTRCAMRSVRRHPQLRRAAPVQWTAQNILNFRRQVAEKCMKGPHGTERKLQPDAYMSSTQRTLCSRRRSGCLFLTSQGERPSSCCYRRHYCVDGLLGLARLRHLCHLLWSTNGDCALHCQAGCGRQAHLSWPLLSISCLAKRGCIRVDDVEYEASICGRSIDRSSQIWGVRSAGRAQSRLQGRRLVHGVMRFGRPLRESQERMV